MPDQAAWFARARRVKERLPLLNLFDGGVSGRGQELDLSKGYVPSRRAKEWC